MARVFDPAKPCCGCGGARDRVGQHYCRECHNAWMRANRKTYAQLTPIERQKANARTMANEYRQRGKLVPKPCEHCGTGVDIEMHHEDYTKPLIVVWLCRLCHRNVHAEC